MQRCLVVVDYQNDFVSDPLSLSDAKILDSLIVEKTAFCAAALVATAAKRRLYIPSLCL